MEEGLTPIKWAWEGLCSGGVVRDEEVGEMGTSGGLAGRSQAMS